MFPAHFQGNADDSVQHCLFKLECVWEEGVEAEAKEKSDTAKTPSLKTIRRIHTE